MPAIPRQRRYDQVMGDREPKVTDKRFVVELQQRLEDKYMTSQCQKEKKLAEAESRRVRKLVLDGIIEADDNRRGHVDSSREQSWKEFWPQNPHKALEEYQEEKRRKAEESRNHQHDGHQTEHHQETEQTEADVESGGGAITGAQQQQQPQQQPAAAPAGRYDACRSPRIDEMLTEENLDELYRKASEIVYVMAPPAKAKPKGKH